MPETNVLITGAATGIGRRIAERFLAAGAKVHVCDTSSGAVEEFLQSQPSASASVTDIGQRSAVEQLFDELPFRHLDVLVNNAGIAGPTAPLADHDEDGWDRCLQVNLSGTFYVTRRAIPLLRRSPQGTIINISSTAAQHGYPQRSAYAASKWALTGLTKTWAMELGAEGIRVNAVCPGSVDGPRIDGVIERDARQRGISEASVRDAYLKQSSMRAFVTADDVADTVLFLASDAAAKISGQSLAVDGHTENLSVSFD